MEMTNEEMIQAIKSNYPTENYSMLRTALDKSMELLAEDAKSSKKHYVWGLQPLDYAFVKFKDKELFDNLDEDEFYSEDEMSNEELNQLAVELMDSDKFQIFGWTEVIEHMEFDDDIYKVLITLAKRYHYE